MDCPCCGVCEVVVATCGMIDAVATASRRASEKGLTRERTLFVALRDSEDSRARRHLFFAEREAAKRSRDKL